MKKIYQAELNGYSNFFMEKAEMGKDASITISCIPYTYETGRSGILSNLSIEKKQGVSIAVKKGGIVTAQLGFGEQFIEMESLKAHLKFQRENEIKLALWGTAGWCDLYINGILSNRTQFRRHSRIVLPNAEWYVGKYVNGEDYLPHSRKGTFHGRLQYIAWETGYKPYIDRFCDNMVSYAGGRGGAAEKEAICLYETQDFSGDIYRPVYHLMPPGKWMNEPHAPFFYQGYYHIFYQANPHAPVWDNICWGHLAGRDMVTWQDIGIALYPDDEKIDIDGCWSGSACFNEDGLPVLFYTAGNNKELPNQSVAIALPEDGNDSHLKKWEKGGIILRQGMKNGFLGEFRDPFVWRKEDTYYILVGSGDAGNGGGNALLYTSGDLKEFTCHGFILDYHYEECTEVGHVWELPVLLPLKNEQGEYACDILLFCACQIENEAVETYYFLGKFDEKNMKFQKFHELPRLFDLGRGTFTGGSGMVTPDGRTVIFTISQGKRNPQEEYDSGWAHNGGMPLDVRIREDVLLESPIAEIRKYFTTQVFIQDIVPDDFGMAFCRIGHLCEHRVICSTSGDFLELILAWGEDFWSISYNRKTKEWKAEKERHMISKLRGKEDLVDIGDEEIKLECYVDHSMIELYLNDKKGMTLRNYPFCKENRCCVKADGICRVEVWEFS